MTIFWQLKTYFVTLLRVLIIFVLLVHVPIPSFADNLSEKDYLELPPGDASILIFKELLESESDDLLGDLQADQSPDFLDGTENQNQSDSSLSTVDLQANQTPYYSKTPGTQIQTNTSMSTEDLIASVTKGFEHIIDSYVPSFLNLDLNGLHKVNLNMISKLLFDIKSNPEKFGISIENGKSVEQYIQDPTDIPFELLIRRIVRNKSAQAGVISGFLGAALATTLSDGLIKHAPQAAKFGIDFTIKVGVETFIPATITYTTLKQIYILHRYYSFLKGRKQFAELKNERFDYQLAAGEFDVNSIKFDLAFQRSYSKAWAVAVVLGHLSKIWPFSRKHIERASYWGIVKRGAGVYGRNPISKLLGGLFHTALLQRNLFEFLYGYFGLIVPSFSGKKREEILARIGKSVNHPPSKPDLSNLKIGKLFSFQDNSSKRIFREYWKSLPERAIHNFSISPKNKAYVSFIKNSESIQALKNSSTPKEINKAISKKMQSEWSPINNNFFSLNNLVLTMFDGLLSSSVLYYETFAVLHYASKVLTNTYISPGQIIHTSVSVKDKVNYNKDFLRGARQIFYPLCFQLANASRYQLSEPTKDLIDERVRSCAKIIALFEGVLPSKLKEERPLIYNEWIDKSVRYKFDGRTIDTLAKASWNYKIEYRMTWLAAIRAIFPIHFIPHQLKIVYYNMIVCESCHFRRDSFQTHGKDYLLVMNPLSASNEMNMSRLNYVLEYLQTKITRARLSLNGQPTTDESIRRNAGNLVEAFRNYFVHEKLKYASLNYDIPDMSKEISVFKELRSALSLATIGLADFFTSFSFGMVTSPNKYFMSLSMLEPKYDNPQYHVRQEIPAMLRLSGLEDE